jgi:hypothetical protein
MKLGDMDREITRLARDPTLTVASEIYYRTHLPNEELHADLNIWRQFGHLQSLAEQLVQLLGIDPDSLQRERP